ncbi:MAG: diguanylate cyclase response regulator [Desulfobacteraceae bacterium 4572_123]|nr:MAG: diguanylate cyclase response regulator [Desulfobacteraceae bacterium 4572_123]
MKNENFPILIAEDDAVTRMLLKKTLIKEGHEVVSVENGQKAFDLFKKSFFPIVLTDWMMPEMNGLELCRAIRQKENPGYVFIVLLTAKDSQGDLISGLEAGADEYLTKPFNRAELIARLNTGRRFLEQELALRQANEEIRILSITDPLTGCSNRGCLNTRLPEEIQRAGRYNRPLSIVMCDIDHFKKVNDTYGHQAGDLVLKEFSKRINDSIRDKVDLLARYGGEEFLVTLPETDLDGALHLAERLRRVISEKEFNIGAKKINITASFGVAGFDFNNAGDEISFDILVRHADEYLYQAKSEGRNRVVGGGLVA